MQRLGVLKTVGCGALTVHWQGWRGGVGGTRTHDQRIKSPLLYRLSYHPSSSNPKLYTFGLLDILCLGARQKRLSLRFS